MKHLRYFPLILALLAFSGCSEQPTVQSIAPAASAEEQERARGASELMPDYETTGIDPKELLDTWIRIKARNATDDREISADALGEKYTVQFNANKTYRNQDGQKLLTGKWKWNGADVILDDGKQTLTIVSVGQGFMTWKFDRGGKTYMYTFKSTRQI